LRCAWFTRTSTDLLVAAGVCSFVLTGAILAGESPRRADGTSLEGHLFGLVAGVGRGIAQFPRRNHRGSSAPRTPISHRFERPTAHAPQDPRKAHDPLPPAATLPPCSGSCSSPSRSLRSAPARADRAERRHRNADSASAPAKPSLRCARGDVLLRATGGGGGAQSDRLWRDRDGKWATEPPRSAPLREPRRPGTPPPACVPRSFRPRSLPRARRATPP